MSNILDKKFYLDTNILRDIITNRNRDSAVYFELAKISNVQLITSAYALMEFVDIKKDEIFFNNKVQGLGWDISRFLKNRNHPELKPHEFQSLGEYWENSLNVLLDANIQFMNLEGNGWELAMGISLKSCLASDDALHLATLLSSQCDYLITNDTDFIKEAKEIISNTDQAEIQCLTSAEALKVLKDIIIDQLPKRPVSGMSPKP